MSETVSREFDFAISFAGPDRDVAAQLAEQLVQHGYVVFYDRAFRSRLVGRSLRKEFKWVFGAGTRFFVPVVSAAYAERPWPQLEWSIAREEAERRPEEFILPMRRDDTILLGLPDDLGYLDLRRFSVADAAQILADKIPLPDFAPPSVRASNKWIAAFGLVVSELLSSSALPADAPSGYAALCDWLEQDLLRRLAGVSLDKCYMPEPSARNGETVSVRVAFDWTPYDAPLEFGDLGWWEVLEVLPFGDMYETGTR